MWRFFTCCFVKILPSRTPSFHIGQCTMFTVALTPARLAAALKPSRNEASHPAALAPQLESNATASAVSELVAAARALALSANESVSLSEQADVHEESDSWTCSSDEDVAMTKHWYKDGENSWEDQSIGVLQLVHGDGDEFRAEAAASKDCISRAFGESISHAASLAEEVTCTPKQHGSEEERECWNALMRAKFRAVRESPFDITILLDTDVFANPSHGARMTVGETLKRHMASGGIDLLAAHEASQIVAQADRAVKLSQDFASNQTSLQELGDQSNVGDTLNLGTLNGGVLVVRKSPITDRFFACAERFMAANTANHDQRALNTLLGEPGKRETSMRSVTQRTLPPEWMCRSHKLERNPMHTESAFSEAVRGAVPVNVPCVFVHSRFGFEKFRSENGGECPLR